MFYAQKLLNTVLSKTFTYKLRRVTKINRLLQDKDDRDDPGGGGEVDASPSEVTTGGFGTLQKTGNSGGQEKPAVGGGSGGEAIHNLVKHKQAHGRFHQRLVRLNDMKC